jgi:superfamily II DNA/RNA helicase
MLVATVGRLMHCIDEGIVDLSRVRYFVLDEADVMMERGFSIDIKELIKQMPPVSSSEEEVVYSMYIAKYLLTYFIQHSDSDGGTHFRHV